MKRIKVINEPTDLVALLRAMDSPTKKDIFQECVNGWVTMKSVEERYGQTGVEALLFFEKMKLVETSWQIDSQFNKEKIYHTYYVSVHINTSAEITEISDVLYITAMDEEEFMRKEKMVYDKVGSEGTFSGEFVKDLELTPTMLKSLVKRSGRLAYKGHRIERIVSED
ncbi:MAG: ArsR family transcriptional regulator [Candidatus Thermoplasmatota archaeon]|nr:ArsR family transcriptional regulator [Candidatus Thermoplasmatota archaeon]